MSSLPRLLITMGDVAGIGPEILAKAWPDLLMLCHPVVVGDAFWLRHGLALAGRSALVGELSEPAVALPSLAMIPCIQGTRQDLKAIEPGKVNAAAGQAAFDFLCSAIDLVQAKKADAIVTLPLHKEGLRAAGLSYPGHTEILGERTGTKNYAMMLYAVGPALPHGLGVVHVTLHMALRDVFDSLTPAAILAKIRMLHGGLQRLCDQTPRLAVAGLNPHASDGGLFGDEEQRLIAPAVQQAVQGGITVSGPWPADTLFMRATKGEFDGIVAMYHDQGHIPMKLLSGLHAVNVTLGLPIVRTSVAHGTAYDIAGKGIADHRSLVEAARVAALLVISKPGSDSSFRAR